jgi:methyltransferase (TIGR00027 family)
MEKRIDTRSSRTAELVCICRAASSLEGNPCYRSDDTLALQILPSPIRDLIQIPFYRLIHCRYGVPRGMYEYVIARTKYMDGVYRQAVSAQFDQIAILGAGFDTRAIRFPAAEDATQVYEFDSKYTQQMKLDLFEKNHVPVPAGVRYEAIDFSRESLAARMEAIGFARDRRCLFLMEGVSMYLEPEAVDATFRTMAEYMGPCSLVAFDYIYADVLRHERRRYGESAAARSVSGAKEPWRFGIAENGIGQFLARYGLHLANHMNPQAMEETYFRNEQGRTTRRVSDIHCLVTAQK